MNTTELLINFCEQREQYRQVLDNCLSRNILLEVRNEHSWTQAELAKVLNCSVAHISKIENGHVNVTVPILIKLSKVLEAIKEIEDELIER